MNDIVDKIVARCHALLSGQAFDDPSNEGMQVQATVHAHLLPMATTEEEKREQIPFVLVRLSGLEESGGKINPKITVAGIIYTADGVAEGMADLLRLIGCLRPLVERGPGNIAGYKIIPPIIWQIGDKETGNQPHPFYQFQADLRFSGV